MNKSYETSVGRSVPNEEELRLINSFTRRELGADEVYVFSLILCDNEIDRDGERFSASALNALGEMFIGKSGIFDHSPTAKNQSARIFSTEVKKTEGKKNSLGEDYFALTARAYIPKTAKNADLIEEIDTGIKKEVSISCSVSSKICSVCGAEIISSPCRHIPGRMYEGKICHHILQNPTDAYEWSFVAVPAQPAAGVTKAYKNKEERMQSIVSKIRENTGGMVISAEEAKELKNFVNNLEEFAMWGKGYKDSLVSKAVRLCAVAVPGMDAEVFRKICEKMDILELEKTGMAFEKEAEKRLPLSAQLSPTKDEESNTHNKDFYI